MRCILMTLMLLGSVNAAAAHGNAVAMATDNGVADFAARMPACLKLLDIDRVVVATKVRGYKQDETLTYVRRGDSIVFPASRNFVPLAQQQVWLLQYRHDLTNAIMPVWVYNLTDGPVCRMKVFDHLQWLPLPLAH